MERIIAALDRYPDNYGRVLGENAGRLRGLVYVMRWAGLAIRDAVTENGAAKLDHRAAV
jgi:hypothetical protein